MAVEKEAGSEVGELVLPEGALLADDLQQSLKVYYKKTRKLKNPDTIHRKARETTNNLVLFLKEHFDPRYCDFITDKESKSEHWYFGKEAIDLLINVSSRRDLIASCSLYQTQTEILKEPQIKAIGTVLKGMDS